MKRFAAVSLAALMVLAVFASCASAADSVEIRGPVYNGTTLDAIVGDGISMDANSFAAFYYDLDEGTQTETLTIEDAEGATIPEGKLVYNTTITMVDFEYAPGFTASDEKDATTQFPVLGFFAEAYIPIEPKSADKLAKLILDDDEKYTLRTGEILDLGEGYALEAKQVDVEGDKVWLEFTKDGEFIDDEIISVVSGETGDWVVDLDDVEDEDDVVVMRMHVNQVFQGAVDSIAQIEGLWLIDYKNAMTIENDDTFGELEVNLQGTTLKLSNDDSITLNKDDDEEIAEGMSFRMADNTESFVRFYPFVEVTIEGAEEEAPVDEEPVDEEPVVDEPVDDGNETVEEPVVDEPVDEEPVDEEPVDDGEEEEPTPGFGFAFGLVGLLAVVYLVRRNN